jgi:hypothetical protein
MNDGRGEAMARESGRVAIIVALITVTGGIITAWITTRHHEPERPAEAQAQQATMPSAGAPPEALQNLSNKQAQALGAETKALDDVTRQIEAAGSNRTGH